MSAVAIVLLIIALVLLITSGVFSILAAIAIKKVSVPRPDTCHSSSSLNRAHSYLTGASIASWIGIALIIVLIILYLVFGSESAAFTASYASVGLLALTLLIMAIVGVLTALASTRIECLIEGNITDEEAHKAYKDSNIAASVSIIGFILLLFVLIFSMYTSRGTTSTEMGVLSKVAKLE